MTGDPQDVLSRLKSVLPARWFGDTTPVLDGVLSGLASAWSWLYDFIAYARLQTRIATATDTWLDGISGDFFGARLLRATLEPDNAFRARILRELTRARATRPAIVQALIDLTGRAPEIFEPARAADTGGYGLAMGYGVAGAWGSLSLRCQLFVTAYRPLGTGIALFPGWGDGAWSSGASAYADLAMIAVQVTDADIYAAIADVLPAAVTAWSRIAD